MITDPSTLDPNQWIAYERSKLGLFKDTPYHISSKSLETYLSKIPEEDRATAASIWQARQGTPASAVYDDLMATYIQMIEPVLNPDEKKVVQETHFAVLPTCEFNGYAGHTPRGDRVVILHDALGYTLNYWSHWYLRVFEQGNSYLSDQQKLAETCAYIIEVWTGHPPQRHTPDIYPKKRDSWHLSEAMTASAIAFVLGHEIGHILHNHPSYTEDAKTNHASEFEADLVGLSIATRFCLLRASTLEQDNYFDKFGLFAPLFAVGVASLFGDEESLTHPSPSQRREHLLSSYQQVFDTIFRSESKKYWDLIDESLGDVMRGNSERLFNLFGSWKGIFINFPISPAYDTSWLKNNPLFTKR